VSATGSFSRADRLIDAEQFRRVFAAARRSRDGHFTVLYCDNTVARPRLGLAISKKRLRRSVDRNRLKRLVRESFRQHRRSLPAVDLVVMAGPLAEKADNSAALASLHAHWQKISHVRTQ